MSQNEKVNGTTEAVETVTLFDKLYGMTQELKKMMLKPTVKRTIKRKLESAWDDAESKIINAEEKIMKTRNNLDDYDINVILEAKKMIKICKELQAGIENEYQELFNEKLYRS